MKRILVTGTAGFIGYHLAELLLGKGHVVHGFDGMTDYYDVDLKRHRNQRLLQQPNFTATEAMLEDVEALQRSVGDFRPDIIVHLAAQAGVRYSLEQPRTYVESNVTGTFNLLEIVRHLQLDHLLIASTSSVYGGSEMPFRETDKADTQMSVYAATKKATESLAHSYAHLFEIPTTMLRFFSVYGPWGRPDLALFRFVDAMLNDGPIELYNRGEMERDFTYVADVVEAVDRLMSVPPPATGGRGDISAVDSLSPIAPFRIVNIGNSAAVPLHELIRILEDKLRKTAARNDLPMQPGEVPQTCASTDLLRELTGYEPQTDIRDGVARFIDWFRDYYGR